MCLPAYAASLRRSARGFGVVVQAHGLNAFGQFARWKSTYKDRAVARGLVHVEQITLSREVSHIWNDPPVFNGNSCIPAHAKAATDGDPHPSRREGD